MIRRRASFLLVAAALACSASRSEPVAVTVAPTILLPRGVLGGTKQLSRLVPPKKLRWMALTGDTVTAQELKSFGGVEAVVAPDSLISTALTYAAKIAERSPTAVRLQKEALNLTEYMALAEGYQVEQAFTGLLSGSSESKEAASSYLEKRDPSYRG